MLSSEQLEALEADGLITPVEAKIANLRLRSPANWPLQNKATMRITMRLVRSLMPYQEVTTSPHSSIASVEVHGGRFTGRH